MFKKSGKLSVAFQLGRKGSLVVRRAAHQPNIRILPKGRRVSECRRDAITRTHVCVWVCVCERERLLLLRWVDRQGGAAGPQRQFSSDG